MLKHGKKTIIHSYYLRILKIQGQIFSTLEGMVQGIMGLHIWRHETVRINGMANLEDSVDCPRSIELGQRFRAAAPATGVVAPAMRAVAPASQPGWTVAQLCGAGRQLPTASVPEVIRTFLF